jgi:hypothetical protein
MASRYETLAAPGTVVPGAAPAARRLRFSQDQPEPAGDG